LNRRAIQNGISSQKANLFEAEISLAINKRLADDDMVEKIYLKKASSFDDATREPDISVRRSAIVGNAACGITGATPYPVLCRIERDVTSVKAYPNAA
jgi:hypothetical protein